MSWRPRAARVWAAGLLLLSGCSDEHDAGGAAMDGAPSASASGSDATGGRDSASGASTASDGPLGGAAAGDGASDTPGVPVLAARRFLLGDVGWDGAHDPSVSFEYSADLDATTSTMESEDHCNTFGTFHRNDGPGGVDNDFARRFMHLLHNFSETAAVSEQTNAAIAAGETTLLLRLDEAAGGAASDVGGQLLLAGSLGHAARFDGGDRWPVRTEAPLPSALDDAGTAISGALDGDGRFVTGAQFDLRLELTLRGYRLPLRVHRATLSLDPPRPGSEERRGVLTGVLHVEEAAAALDRLARQVFRSCDELVVLPIAGQAENLGDIMRDLGNGDPTTRCDAISVGIGLVFAPAQAAGIEAYAPPPDPCPGGEVATSDGALAGTCESLPPYALSVSCSPIARHGTAPDHRPQAVACERERPRGPVCLGQVVGYTDYPPDRACTCHEQCTDGANGRCYVYGYHCSYDACFEDADCGDQAVCECGTGEDGGHRCVAASCRVDADCAGGHACSPTRGTQCTNISPIIAYVCHTDADACQGDDDCEGLGACVHDPDLGSWRCVDSICTVP